MINKIIKICLSFSLSICLLFVINCQSQEVKTNSNQNKQLISKNIVFPPIGTPKKIDENILVYEIEIKNNRELNKVWVYLPKETKKEKIPCILIASAGSRLIDGSSLGEGSRPEHIPYVKAGFAVIAYDISGEPKDDSDESTIEAATKFKESIAGLKNQKNALDFALEKFPKINSEQIYIGGYSSAATHALFVGANEPRIKGIVSYAPATDIEKFIGEGLDAFDDYISGFHTFIKGVSPINNTSKIKVPVFLFHSEEDSTVSVNMTEEFIEKLKKTNPNIIFVKAKKGDHYFSMLNQGIPKGIDWLNEQIKK